MSRMLWIEINYFEIKLIFSVLLFLILDTGAFKISNPQTFLAYDKEAVIQGMCGQLLFCFSTSLSDLLRELLGLVI